MKFLKLDGAGNDFIALDNRNGEFTNITNKEIASLCNRFSGIGADGLLILDYNQKDKSSNESFYMKYFNSDGSRADMCGNGARCFARYIQTIVFNSKKIDKLNFLTDAGNIDAQFIENDIEITIDPPHNLKQNIIIDLSDEEKKLLQKSDISQKKYFKNDEDNLIVYFINTGVPHVVVPIDDIEKLDIKNIGSWLRFHKKFQPNGANINFLDSSDVKNKNCDISVRTYERGVEDETLACGTGVIANAISYYLINGSQNIEKPIKVKVKNGDIMRVNFDEKENIFSNVKLRGPANINFEGKWLK